MNEAQVTAAVIAWADALIDEIETTYDYPAAQVTGALPDLACEVLHKRIVRGDADRFPFTQIQAAWLRVFDCQISIMVDAGKTEAQSRTAHLQLYDFGEAIELAVRSDAELGGELAEGCFASPIMDFDYSLPFAERPGGVRGRIMTVEFSVGELIEEPEG